VRSCKAEPDMRTQGVRHVPARWRAGLVLLGRERRSAATGGQDVARVWRRRRSLDIGRPAGRRWARLRRSGSRATQVLVRVAGRRAERGGAALAGGTQVVYPPRPDRAWRRIAARREM